MDAMRFAWGCIDSPEWLPPEPKRGTRFAQSSACWLCGNATDGHGWPRVMVIGDKFTNHNFAACPTSDAICGPCAYFLSSESWQAYGAAHPELGVQTKLPFTWRAYSHAFTPTAHECPARARWRQLLIDPPSPPFLFVISLTGKKHLLFRATVAHDRDRFPVQVEERTVMFDRARFTACLADFERLYALGFSKDSIVSGQYHHGQLHKVGLATWREAETAFAPWRTSAPDLVTIAHFCAQRPEEP